MLYIWWVCTLCIHVHVQELIQEKTPQTNSSCKRYRYIFTPLILSAQQDQYSVGERNIDPGLPDAYLRCMHTGKSGRDLHRSVTTVVLAYSVTSFAVKERKHTHCMHRLARTNKASTASVLAIQKYNYYLFAVVGGKPGVDLHLTTLYILRRKPVERCLK